MEYLLPPRLKLGDKVGVISPSSTIKHRREEYERAAARLEQGLGIKLVPAKNAFNSFYYSGGTIQERLDDFHDMVCDREIKGIIFSAGGNSAIDLVDKLNYALIKKNPKIIAGISDACTFLNSIAARTGLIAYEGFEFFDFNRGPVGDYGFAYLEKAWFKESIGETFANPSWRNFGNLATRYRGWRTFRPGKAEGVVAGGNLSVILNLIDTPYFPELDGSILACESYLLSKRDINARYKVLRLKKVFEKISGLIVGYNHGSDDPKILGNDRDIKDIVLEATAGYDFPIMEVGEIGHRVENIILPIGGKAKLDATNRTLKL